MEAFGVAEGALIVLVLDRFVTFARALVSSKKSGDGIGKLITCDPVASAKLDEVIRHGERTVTLLESIRANGRRCPFVPGVSKGGTGQWGSS